MADPVFLTAHSMISAADEEAVSRAIVAELGAAPRRPYRWLPAVAESLAGEPTGEAGAVRRVLGTMLESFDPARSPFPLPDSIAGLYERETARLRHLLANAGDEGMRFSLDARRKDLAILSFRLIPAGAEFAEPGARIWLRKLVFSGGLGQAVRAAAFFSTRARPFGRYFQLHMHPESKDDFHEAGWMVTYRRLGELLEANPDHCGWYSASWFVDPALGDISPHLDYLREVPRRNGGALFCMGSDGGGSSGALATSRTRRRLHAEGSYVPKIYLRVWPRESAISWGRRQEGVAL